MTRSYYRNVAGILQVYDVTKKYTFENIKHWLEEAKVYGHKNNTFQLIGNKSDLNSKRQVSYFEGEQFAKKNNMEFIETSAKDNINVQEGFVQTAMTINRKINRKEILVDRTVFITFFYDI